MSGMDIDDLKKAKEGHHHAAEECVPYDPESRPLTRREQFAMAALSCSARAERDALRDALREMVQLGTLDLKDVEDAIRGMPREAAETAVKCADALIAALDEDKSDG